MSESMAGVDDVTAPIGTWPAPQEDDVLQRRADATLWRIEEVFDDGAVGLSRVDSGSLCVATIYLETTATDMMANFILVASGDRICASCRRRLVCPFASTGE